MSDESGHGDCGDIVAKCRCCGAQAGSISAIAHASGCINACEGKMADFPPTPHWEPEFRKQAKAACEVGGQHECVSPQHYKDGRIEAIDAIRSALGHQGFKDYCRGQVIRYLWRIGKKDDELVEVGKAQCYLRWMKETMDGKELSK